MADPDLFYLDLPEDHANPPKPVSVPSKPVSVVMTPELLRQAMQRTWDMTADQFFVPTPKRTEDG